MNFFLTSPRPLLTFSWWRPISYRNQSNQWTGFYMISASVMKGLIKNVYSVYYRQLQHRPLPTRALIPTTYWALKYTNNARLIRCGLYACFSEECAMDFSYIFIIKVWENIQLFLYFKFFVLAFEVQNKISFEILNC